MKKKLMILLLMLTLLLCGCSAPAAVETTARPAAPQAVPTVETQAPEAAPEFISPLSMTPREPTAESETQETLPLPEPIPEPTPEPVIEHIVPEQDYTPFRELVDKIRQGCADGWTTADIEALGLSPVFKEPDYFPLGWLQMDINYDGVDELLFGVNGTDGEAGATYDIFTILNGNLLAHPVCGGVFSKWFVLENGQLVNETSNDGFDRWYSVYGYFNGMLVQVIQPVDRSDFMRLVFEPFAPAAETAE